MYFVYILKCSNGSLYTGITTDVDRRFAEHKSGKGSRYTRSKGAGEIVHIERKKNRSTASKREAVIKKMSRVEKLELAEMNEDSLRSR
jgi:putative endonuclease